MIIWRLDDPCDSSFAEAGLRGAWSEGKYCQECTGSTEHRVHPLIMEWAAGSDSIGDFTCTGVCSGFAITEQVANTLQRYYTGFEPGAVTMIQSPKVKKPRRITKRTKPRVWLPYEGPVLYELWLVTRVHMDSKRTTAKLVRSCEKCGSVRWELKGYEHEKHTVKVIKQEGQIQGYEDIVIHYPRVPGQGLFVRGEDLGGADFFGIHEFSGWVFCTDRAKRVIEEQGFTNIAFHEMGDVV